MKLHTAGTGRFTGKPRCGTPGGRQAADLTKVTCQKCVQLDGLDKPGVLPEEDLSGQGLLLATYVFPPDVMRALGVLPPRGTSLPPGPRSGRWDPTLGGPATAADLRRTW